MPSTTVSTTHSQRNVAAAHPPGMFVCGVAHPVLQSGEELQETKTISSVAPETESEVETSSTAAERNPRTSHNDRLIVSIDIGLINLGLVAALVDTEHRIRAIVHAERVDITVLRHRHVSRAQCTLFHSAHAADRVQHFIQDTSLLREADVLLLERQPLCGLIHVEQLLYNAFRDKAILCSPVRMHIHFDLPRGKQNYDARKLRTVEIARPLLVDLPAWSEQSDRLQDLADAMCIMLWWLQTQQQKDQKVIALPSGQSIDSFFEQFRFVPAASHGGGTKQQQ